MADADKIPFVVEVSGKSGGRGIGFEDVPADKLRRSLEKATRVLAETFSSIGRVGEFELRELTLGLEIGAEGGVHFIGTSKVSGSGSITLTFGPPPVHRAD